MLRFHFLNVGDGDCTLVELPSGRLMMVDINNSASLPDGDIVELAALHGLKASEFRTRGSYSLSKSWEDYYEGLLVDPFDYYQANFPGKPIFRYIQTHPDMDHMSGLHRFFWQEKTPIFNFWDIHHEKQKTEGDFEGSPHSYLDWLVYELLREGNGPKDESGNHKKHRVIKNHRLEEGQYWSHDSIEVLSPSPDLIAHANENESWNNASYVLKFNHGGRSVILAGDAEQVAWESILEDVHDQDLRCDVLKAAHHGRKSGYHQEAVDKMQPASVICSIGKKPQSDGHADYVKHGAEVFSTRSNGTITVTVWDDGEVWVNDYKGQCLQTIGA